MLELSAELLAQARKMVLDHFLAHEVPPLLEDLMVQFRLSRVDAFEVLRALEEAHHLKLVPATQRILMAFPFSSIATPFRVTANGRQYFANCAWDSVALHATLGKAIRIDSRCHHCASPLEIVLEDGRMSQSNVPDPRVYIAIPASRWWEDILVTCSNHMVFFQSEDHLRRWRDAHAGAGGESLSVELTHRLGEPIYRHKMRLDYARPPKEQLAAHFTSLGLTGEFWRL